MLELRRSEKKICAFKLCLSLQKNRPSRRRHSVSMSIGTVSNRVLFEPMEASRLESKEWADEQSLVALE